MTTAFWSSSYSLSVSRNINLAMTVSTSIASWYARCGYRQLADHCSYDRSSRAAVKHYALSSIGRSDTLAIPSLYNRYRFQSDKWMA